MTKRFDAVIFDAGRVLVALDLSSWMSRLFAGSNLNTIKKIREIMTEEICRRFFIGETDGSQFHREMGAAYGINLPYSEFKRVWSGIFRPMPGMEGIVRRVGKNYRLGLLSDTDPIHWEFLLRNYPILKHFSNPTLSFRIGTLKPDSKMYLAAAAAVEAEPQRCFFIDDMDENVEGARKAGMTAVQFKDPDQLCRDLQAAGIIELYRL